MRIYAVQHLLDENGVVGAGNVLRVVEQQLVGTQGFAAACRYVQPLYVSLQRAGRHRALAVGKYDLHAG